MPVDIYIVLIELLIRNDICNYQNHLDNAVANSNQNTRIRESCLPIPQSPYLYCKKLYGASREIHEWEESNTLLTVWLKMSP